MSIDALLTAKVKKRDIRAMTLWPASGGGWQCNVQHLDGSWTCNVNPDPADGLRRALEGKSSPSPVDPDILI